MTTIDHYDFHDGAIIDITCGEDDIAFAMESAEVCAEDSDMDLELSEHGTIKGKLHMDGVDSIKINGKKVQTIKKEHDSGNIFRFKITEDTVLLLVSWVDYPPKPYFETDLFTIEVVAKKIYWENIPDLFDPFW